MRRYEISVNGHEYELEVDDTSATTFRVRIGDKEVDVTVNSEGDVADAQITPAIESTTATGAAPKVSEHVAPNVPSSPQPHFAQYAAGSDLAYTMSAPMPGVIKEVLAAPGDTVTKGDVVMVLEAMKMENDLHASRDGMIADVVVAAGDQVKYGQLLLKFSKD